MNEKASRRSETLSRPYRLRFLQANTHFATFLNFRDLQYLHFLCTFRVEMEKNMENHLVDPTEKAENAESHSHRSKLRISAFSTNFVILGGQILEILRFPMIFIVFRCDFDENLSEFHEIFGIFVASVRNFDGLGVRRLPRKFK